MTGAAAMTQSMSIASSFSQILLLPHIFNTITFLNICVSLSLVSAMQHRIISILSKKPATVAIAIELFKTYLKKGQIDKC